MRACFLHMLFSLYCLTCFAQKPPIEANTLKNWISVTYPQISDNGEYASYIIENQPFGKRTVIFKNIKTNNWKLEIPGFASINEFTSDSKYAICIKEKDSLAIIKTGYDIVHYIPFVQSFILPKRGNESWLIYQLNNSPKTLYIYNLETEKEKSIDFVKQYLLSDDGSTLVYLTEEKDSGVEVLHWFDIASGNLATIWHGKNAGNFVFAKNGKQLAFSVEQSAHKLKEKTFWYFKAGEEKAVELVTNTAIKDDSTLMLENILRFSIDDGSLFVKLKQRDFSKPSPSFVDIWSYNDIKLKPLQLKELYPKSYMAIIQIKNSQLIRLERDNETLVLSPFLDNRSDEWGLVINRPCDFTEEYWNSNCSLSAFLVSTKSGEKKIIPDLNNLSGKISPQGKYIIYYNQRKKDLFSYETKTGITRDITKHLHVEWTGFEDDLPNTGKRWRGIAGWGNNDDFVLIYDHNDIWQIDMAGEKPPLNITNGYGKAHNIVFSLSLNSYRKTFANNEQLIINAFNRDNKENGYYRKTLSKLGDPELLSMGPYVYDIPGNPYVPDNCKFTPIKAQGAEVYLVERMKATEAPNYFITTDFKKFKPLSDVQPQNRYNWLTSELVSWKGLDGRRLQGILYKPENFDSTKKYPVIVHYYEKKTDGLNAFLEPDFLSGNLNINIPWYVSNGYLVFLPDIHYKIGETGESVINSVLPSVQYLCRMNWVNSKKIGIQGGSFGGYETNYLITHTTIFAAACSASGLSNLVSSYGALVRGSTSKQIEFECTQFRLGVNLWQRSDVYIKNSPIFFANRVETPLLIMHTTQDGTCPFADAAAFFTALRRLGKKAWMLQYNDGDHGVYGKSAIDFSTRMIQFFDHYLKDKPAVEWMTGGEFTAKKGVETGCVLDSALGLKEK